ncbi:glycosyltransferase [Roseovarius nanhaiticus]|uniref:glycosyltransferase n=1 Tax=Roseovarius nanhaiticus TaxID=573024 RepID=UPI0024910614|nr:glycosyltransferase [Roseovarius nanhaiticus]
MTLALVICVRDDQRNLDRLLTQALQLGIFEQIVIVDDASRIPVRLQFDCMGPCRCPITLLRHRAPRGAGAARNAGLELVRTDHMIFFDSDDLFTKEIIDLWNDLRGQQFDFCVMRYQDSERGHFGGIGQTLYDEACWLRAGCVSAAPRRVGRDAIWSLAEANNFPWNKIYRTRFLRANAIRCTETRVHNDIELHWRSFAAARRIFVSTRLGAIHVVRPGGDRLTNQNDAARLDLFSALRPASDAVMHDDDDAPKLAFLRFSAGILTWGERVIAPDLRDAFAARRQQFLRSILTIDLYEAVLQKDPVLALRLMLMIAPETAKC